MKRSAMAVTVFGMLAGAALAQGGAKVLFDGKSLGAWEPIGDANWTIVEGAVQATGGNWCRRSSSATSS